MNDPFMASDDVKESFMTSEAGPGILAGARRRDHR
jgi:hypothetical protein